MEILNSHLRHFNHLIILFCIIFFSSVACQYNNDRCKCICPSPKVVTNQNETDTHFDRKLYIDNVEPTECNCDGVVLPYLRNEINSKEFCPLCECKYESRNTYIMKYGVVFIILVISILVVCMLFFLLFDPYLQKGGHKSPYQEQINEELSLEEPVTTRDIKGSREVSFSGSKNVLDRVGQKQEKWKKQVIEQRKNIYDNHTMLN